MAVELLALPLVLLYILIGLAAYWYLTARPKNVPPGPLGTKYLEQIICERFYHILV